MKIIIPDVIILLSNFLKGFGVMEKYLINPNHKIAVISKDIYGHFSEHLGRNVYEGIYVGEDSDIPNKNGMRTDVISALKEMGVPVLRWPGGCFADEYHWMDGIGSKENRKKIINTHWGGVVENNSFGTHEFFELCDQLGCDAYINGNVGSGSVREMSEWVEYMEFDGTSPMAELRKKNGREKPWTIKYFGVGNENWGCGGNMEPEFYGNEFNKYNTFVRDYAGRGHIYRIASGPNKTDYNWTEGVMKVSHRHMNGLALHYYTVPGGWGDHGFATEFDDDKYLETIIDAYGIDDCINHHLSVMDKYDREHKVDLVIDEWGTWYNVEPGTNPGFLYQQNTIRDAMVAGLTLNIFNKHADRISMANIAQMVNVLQSVILTDGEKMIKTPTYHVFKMFKPHQNANLLSSYITTDFISRGGDKIPSLIESASEKDGVITSTIANVSLTESKEIKCQVADTDVKDVKAEIITGKKEDHNTFEDPENVITQEFTEFTKSSDGFTAKLPPLSVVSFAIK